MYVVAAVARELGWQTVAVEWDPSGESESAAAAHATGHEVLELEGGDHQLELDRDAIGSARFLVSLATRARAFFESLPSA